MTDKLDPEIERRREQLYRLLPELYRALDSEKVPDDRKGPLREFLSVIGEQVNLLEDDLARWYENWFIETCEDWVVPYLGDLLGFESAARELNTVEDPESPLNRAVVFPRREIADTIALRRRKGTLAVLEELSRRLVGWPARGIEYRRLTSGTASTNHLRARRSSTVNLRNGRRLALLDTAFDELPRTADVRRIHSRHTQSRHNLPNLALFVCRRKIDSATLVPTCVHGSGELHTLDVQGFDIPLHIRPVTEPSPDTIAEVVNLPMPLTRHLLRRRLQEEERQRHARPLKIVGANPAFYGIDKSVFVVAQYGDKRRIIKADEIFVTDLAEWTYNPAADDGRVVALDPERGRIAFHPEHVPDAVWSTCHYGRPSYMGGGEYDRRVSDGKVWQRVTRGHPGTNDLPELTEALKRWQAGPPIEHHTVIEIADSEEYPTGLHVTVPQGKTLEIRSANRFRPLLHVPDVSRQRVERCHITGEPGSHLILDGLLFGEGELLLDGEFSSILIRHCTLTPGRAHLTLRLNAAQVQLEHCILGTIVTRTPEQPRQPPASRPAETRGSPAPPQRHDPTRLLFYDCILDGKCSSAEPMRSDTSERRPAEASLSGTNRWAHVVLTAVRTTVFGEIEAHAVRLIENSLLLAQVCIENCQTGCVRFSYVFPGSCTPPQFHCQPALAIERAQTVPESPDMRVAPTDDEVRRRVLPRFVSTQYAHPDYARLADDCATEILTGADDEGELGAYHNEFYSQRARHLRQRLEEFIPAGHDVAILFAT